MSNVTFIERGCGWCCKNLLCCCCCKGGVSSCKVATYIPNIIGYLRFISLCIGTHMAVSPREKKWVWFVFFYGLSYVLDAFDGCCARRYNMTSKFGAGLDMICDRAQNSVMYFVLSMMHPDYSFAFYLCFLLDFGSHWLQFMSSASSGAHHKGKNSKENWLVSLYYNNSMVFKIVVLGAEVGTVCLYILSKEEPKGVPPIHPLSHIKHDPIFKATTAVLTVILAFKMFVNVYQWFGAMDRLATLDATRSNSN